MEIELSYNAINNNDDSNKMDIRVKSNPIKVKIKMITVDIN